MIRPHRNSTIDTLEAIFTARATDVPFLQELIDELAHRSTERSARLKRKAIKALEDASGTDPMPATANVPMDVLTAWTALEVLSPQSFVKPENLARKGEEAPVARLDQGPLPWEGHGERPRRKMRLFYQIVLGSIDLRMAVDQLTSVYADSRAEHQTARGEAVLAVVMVDDRGCPLTEMASPVSSFGWGLPRALDGEMVPPGVV